MNTSLSRILGIAFLLICTLLISQVKALDDSFEDEKFADSLQFIPVKITEKEKTATGYSLTGRFDGSILAKIFRFKLSIKFENHSFFKRVGDEAEEIDFDKFIDKCKDESWLIKYLPEQENEILHAQQYKSWEALRQSYAQSEENGNETVHSLEFWDQLRAKIVVIETLKENVLTWIFSRPIEAKDVDLKKLDIAGSRKVGDIELMADGSFELIQNRGTFIVHEKCLFSTFDIKTVKGLPIVGRERIRIKSKLLPSQFFLDNLTKFRWFCYYNKSTGVALRITQIPPKDDEYSQDQKEKKQ